MIRTGFLFSYKIASRNPACMQVFQLKVFETPIGIYGLPRLRMLESFHFPVNA